MNLCPHESDILIKDIVQKIEHIVLMKLLLILFDKAISCFKKQDLACFDAQVGENLCQIRAYKIFLLNKSNLFHSDLHKVQERIYESIKILNLKEEEYRYWLSRNKADRPKAIRDPLVMSDFFQEMGVVITFESNLFYIFLCYFLCKYCVVDDENIPFTMDYQHIQEELNLSKSFSKRMVHYYQKHLSELSCHFIFELLGSLNEYQELNFVLKLLHRKADEGRMVLPCFLVTKIIVQHMIQTEADLILVCNLKMGLHKELVAFIFKGSNYTQNFDLQLVDKQNSKLNYLIFYGEHQQPHEGSVGKFLSEISFTGLKDVILYNNAAHPQFSGQILIDFREDPFLQLIKECEEGNIGLNTTEIVTLTQLSHKIVEYKHHAIQLGCTRERPRLFLLKHIFCDNLNNYNSFLYPG